MRVKCMATVYELRLLRNVSVFWTTDLVPQINLKTPTTR